MFKGLAKVLGGDPVRRQLESYAEAVEHINSLEPGLRELDDDALKKKPEIFRERLQSGESVEDILHEAFALVREVSVRVLGLRHFDVQLIGGMVLHEGKIAEMRTGEGKTLVATMPIFLNALQGGGVHLVTVNDYLARRDARWMGPIFHFLGLSVGVLQEASRTEHGRKAFLYDPTKESSQEDIHQLQIVDRKQAYLADVTYGTNNEFGFDYLRDNMARSLEARVQRGHHYAILDEVDNILIDEARTPLIISGPSHEDPELYTRMARVVTQLQPEDFEVSERDRTVSLTEIGEDHVEQLLDTPLRDPDRPEDISPEQARLLGYLEQSLRGQYLFSRNKEYVVQSGRVIIVDEFTGRLMPGRRWSDGLHQAIEAKEGVRIRQENVTYATVTLQNYFRMYEKLAGMTGTAVTEAEEFHKIYSVEVIPLPTNLAFIAMREGSSLEEIEFRENGNKFKYYARKEDSQKHPVFWQRKDYQDVVYRTEEAKLRAVTTEILVRHIHDQPMLVGTTSVELSERLSSRLRAESLQQLMNLHLIRDAYLEAQGIEDDGMRIEALEALNQPLDELKLSELRQIARELELSFNPTRPENIERLTQILGFDPSEQNRLGETLKSGIPHNVLNAKKHDEESAIIAWAGSLGAVTIATNMAGRGVDIKLGGEIAEEILASVNRVLRRASIDDPESMSLEERLEAVQNVDERAIGIYGAEIEQLRQFMEDGIRVREAGGLHVIGSERHDARRIDNQLRGRAARQGDPGSSQFFLSLEDELMRLFGGSRVSGLMQTFKIDDAMPLEANIVGRTIEQAQTRVEGANFDTRKHLLEYDDVLNQQREVFYSQRNRVFGKDDLTEDLAEMLQVEVEKHVLAALEDPEGFWKLLAWLEETQPTLGLETEDPYPSYMLRLLLDQLAEANEVDVLKEQLLLMVRQSLEAQIDHIVFSLDQQLTSTIERLDDQVQQRVEAAEMAVEAAIFESEELGSKINPRALLEAVEQSAGLRIQMDSKSLDQVQLEPETFLRQVPRFVEASMGLRVWAGLIQAVERRVGESLGLEAKTTEEMDWDKAEEEIQAALGRVWSERTERLLNDVEVELNNTLTQGADISETLKTRLLVQMSYGRQTVFDRKTHKRQAVMFARLSYAFVAARLLDDQDPETIIRAVIDHLDGARLALQKSLGGAEFARIQATAIDDLADQQQDTLRREWGEEAFAEFRTAGPLNSRSEDAQDQAKMAFGSSTLMQYYRDLLLTVGDRSWVDYLTQMEALRTSIGLEAYGQRDPLVQYKSRAFDMFGQLLADIRTGVVSRLFRIQPRTRPSSTRSKPAKQPKQVASQQAPKTTEEPKGKRKRKRRRRR